MNTNIKTVLGLFHTQKSVSVIFVSKGPHLRKSKPSRRPSSHEETDTLLLIRFGKDFAEAGFHTVDCGSALDATLEYVGGCACCGCYSSGDQGGEEVEEDAVFKTKVGVREEVVFCGGVADIG
jgi:hypothetical protein